MVLSLIVTPIVSKMTKTFDEAHIERVFGEDEPVINADEQTAVAE